MNWRQFLETNKVGHKYHNAIFENDKLMDPKNREFGIDWSRNPKKSLILFGGTGRGKTHFMFALIHQILQEYYLGFIRFFKSKKMDDKLFEEFKKYGSNSDLIERIIEVPVLLIDDFGVERPTERAARDMYEIIDGRIEWERPTVISTNLSDSGIKKAYGDRIWSRLKEYVWLNFEGEDLRGIL